MSEQLVTVGTFPDVMTAYLAKGRLEEAGIVCFITNENTGGWMLGMPTSWPKVQVAEGDAFRAIAVLESRFEEEFEGGDDQPHLEGIMSRDGFARRSVPAAPEPEPDERAFSAPDDDEEPGGTALKRIDRAEPESRSALAVRAFRAALIGFLFFGAIVVVSRLFFFVVVPVLLYSLYLLVKVWESGEPLTPGARRRAWAALVLDGLVIVGFALLLGAVLDLIHGYR
jgi:hypothetical protein